MRRTRNVILRRAGLALLVSWALLCITLVLRGERRLEVLGVAPLIGAAFCALVYVVADMMFDRLLRIVFRVWRNLRG